VRTDSSWLDAPPLPGGFVCSVGEVLDRMTGGRCRPLPHRVRINASGRDRLSVQAASPDRIICLCAMASIVSALRSARVLVEYLPAVCCDM